MWLISCSQLLPAPPVPPPAQPRVLDVQQLANMQTRLGAWLQAVGKASSLITAGAPELIAAH